MQHLFLLILNLFIASEWTGRIEVEVIPHAELKKRSREVNTVVRTGDFTAWGNVLLVSGAGHGWIVER